jgi:hypothetical protein
MKAKVFLLVVVISAAVLMSGCGWFEQVASGVSTVVGTGDTAIVIAKTAEIRTSYAVVAGDLLEVKRGDRLDVLDQVESPDTKGSFWYRVRAHDEGRTEGWIEAQNVITSAVLDKSQKLAESFKNVPPQAAGQLRAASNLRLASDMSPDNVLYRLSSGSTFEIMSWKFVPKQEVPDVDDNTNSAQKGKHSKNEEIEAANDDDEPDKLDDKYDTWYLVKLDPSVSPAPAGWLFGRQVELQVPTDVQFYQDNNRKFVAWQRLDSETADKGTVSKASTPGNWAVLTRANTVEAIDGVEPDFDGIVVYAFDKYDQNYYMVWRTNGQVWGQLPLRIEGTGDGKSFIVKLRGPDGQMVDKRFSLVKDKGGRLRVTPPEDIGQFMKK